MQTKENGDLLCDDVDGAAVLKEHFEKEKSRMPDEASLTPCKICGKKFEKVGFHVRKKHAMSMDDYRKLPTAAQEQMPAVAEEKPIAAGISDPIMQGEVAAPIEVDASERSEKRPWYKKLLFGLV